MHSDHSGVAFAGGGNRSDSHHRGTHRSIDLFDERFEFRTRASSNYPTADKTNWSLGTLDQFKRFGKSFFAEAVNLGLNRFNHLALVFRHIDGDILRHVDENRSRPSFLGDFKRKTDRLGQIVYVFDDEVMFCHRHRNPGDIHLLEGVLT